MLEQSETIWHFIDVIRIEIDRHGSYHKIRRLPPYVFADVNAMKAEACAAGEDIIDLANPDQPPAPHIIDKLKETVENPGRYSNSRGISDFAKPFPLLRAPFWG